MKPKVNRKGSFNKSNKFDQCQTPQYAIEPLLPYLPTDWVVWECAAGEGSLVETLRKHGCTVIASDILDGRDFFQWEPGYWDCIITNPPYSVKYEWLERCYQLGKPFALLMPVESIGARSGQVLFERYSFEWIFLNKRVDFKMPDKGFNGSGAQFPVAWFTWGLGIGRQVTFAKIMKRDDRQIVMPMCA